MASRAVPSTKPVATRQPNNLAQESTRSAEESTESAQEPTKLAAKSDEPAEAGTALADEKSGVPVVRLAASVPFGTARSRLTRRARARLRRFVEQVRDGDARLRVEGHTDNRGSERANRALARARARRVIGALKKNGISADRIDPPVSHGSRRPLAEGQSAAIWSQNRRVEIFTVAMPRNTTKRM